MRIPIATQGQSRVPSVNIGASTLPYEAMQKTGEQLGEAATVVQNFEIRKREIYDKYTAFSALLLAEKKSIDLESSLSSITNYEEYMSRWGNGWKEIQDATTKSVKTPGASRIVEMGLGKLEIEKYEKAKRTSNILFEQELQGGVLGDLNEIVKLAENERDLSKIDEYKTWGDRIIQESGEDGVFNKDRIPVLSSTFSSHIDTAVKVARNNAILQGKGIVRQHILKDADSTISFLDKGVYNSLLLNDQDAIADMKEKAAATKVVQDNQRRLDEERVKKDLHDKEEVNIGQLFWVGKLNAAFVAVGAAGNISGDEKRTWTTAIQQTQKGEDNIDPYREMWEVARIKELIAKDEDPSVVKQSILTSSKLRFETKKELYNKVDVDVSTEVKRGTDQSYSYLRSQIAPSSGLLPATPIQSQAYHDAQNALDEWIKTSTISGKPPSGEEIYDKANSLASLYRPKVDEVIDQQNKETREILDAMRKKKKLPTPDVVPPAPKPNKYPVSDDEIRGYIRWDKSHGKTVTMIKRQLKEANIDPDDFKEDLK